MTKSKKKTKAAASPAPAKKPVPTKSRAAAKSARPAKPAGKPARPPAKSPARAPAERPAAAHAPQPVTPVPVTTVVTANIDVGFGNVLTIRGEGPGLSWDRGASMECVASDQWRVELGESARPYVFKFLVNDLSWSSGPDYTVVSGESVTVVPSF